MLDGATLPEIAFTALLVALVLLAPIVPRLGAAVGRVLDRGAKRPGAAGEKKDRGDGPA